MLHGTNVKISLPLFRQLGCNAALQSKLLACHIASETSDRQPHAVPRDKLVPYLRRLESRKIGRTS